MEDTGYTPAPATLRPQEQFVPMQPMSQQQTSSNTIVSGCISMCDQKNTLSVEEELVKYNIWLNMCELIAFPVLSLELKKNTVVVRYLII